MIFRRRSGRRSPDERPDEQMSEESPADEAYDEDEYGGDPYAEDASADDDVEYTGDPYGDGGVDETGLDEPRSAETGAQEGYLTAPARPPRRGRRARRASTAEPDEIEDLGNRARGPWDREETAADQGSDGYVDLGGLVIKGFEGIELRMQVQDQQGNIAAVMLATPESGLELRAFAAPRSGGIWEEVRNDIAAEARRLGGTVTEVDGEFGTELVLAVPVVTPDGKQARQDSRIVGVEGPRWLLRGTFFGRSVQEPDPDGLLETAFRDVIVVRGDEPMAPREMIPMQMPAQAQAQLMAQQEEGDPDEEPPGTLE